MVRGQMRAACTVCGCKANAARGGGIHSVCAARGLGGGDVGGLEEIRAWAEKSNSLPTMADVFTTPCATKEYTNNGL